MRGGSGAPCQAGYGSNMGHNKGHCVDNGSAAAGRHVHHVHSGKVSALPGLPDPSLWNPGISNLLRDLERLSEDRDSSDLVFLVGKDESPIWGHRLIYASRCKHFSHQGAGAGGARKRTPSGVGAGGKEAAGSEDVCQVRGWTVKPGSPVTILVPHFSVEAFRTVHRYIYTGNVTLTEESVFEIMSLSQCLGLEQLHQWTEDHVAASLNPLNACALLGAAVALEERTKGCISKTNGETTFVDTCVSYIGENASECVRTPSFRALTKEALTRLISSDQFALEEEEVWRAVLSWAKTQANVNSATSAWSEEERKRVCSHLAPVIQYVRLLLIDSQVFAEEVEPTGAVPLELILERYRVAALSGAPPPGSAAGGAPGHHPPPPPVPGAASGAQGKFRQNGSLVPPMGAIASTGGPGAALSDPRFQPRAPPNRFFPGSQILAREDAGFQRLLNQWYGDPRESWTLVFRASEHKFSALAFHHFCDGVAPTYILVLGTNGEVCGGFSDIPWGAPTSSSKSGGGSAAAQGGGGPAAASGYCASDVCFLFTLKNPHDLPPSKFPVVKRTFAVAQHPDIGPIFGAGADLCISDRCDVSCESYSNLPHSYDGDNAFPGVLMGAYNFNVVDYEVFTPSVTHKGKSEHQQENNYSNTLPGVK